MYYPKSQIITNLYTKGGELAFAKSTTTYIGYYYETSDGRYFSNKSPEDTPSNELFPTSKGENNTTSKFPQPPKRDSYYLIKGIYSVLPYPENYAPSKPKQISPLPTSEEYELGEFTRYFAYKSSTNQTIEITKKEFIQYENQDSSVQYELYTPVTLIWVLKGKLEEVAQTNFNLVNLKEKGDNLPGFSKYFRGKYTQYFKYNQNENLYSNGSELVYTKNKKPYIGYYHIHPEKGPMAGRQHKVEPHDYLEFIPTGSTLNPISISPQSGSYVESSNPLLRTGGSY